MDKKHTTLIVIIIIILLAIGLYVAATKTKIVKNSPIVVEPEPVDTEPDPEPVAKDRSFVDGDKTVTFNYPQDFIAIASRIGDWRTNTTIPGKRIASLTIPKSYQASTNFSEATFTIGSSNATQGLTSCLTPMNGERAKGTAVIGGETFTKITLSEGAAGNYYDTTSYRIVKNGQCYAVEYTIHSTNFANYPADSGIKEFDTQKIVGVLEGMVQSFAFTKAN
jgi:hypothetical protein